MSKVSLFPSTRQARIAAYGQCAVSDNARQVLEARYLRRDDSGAVAESPEDMFWRVAETIARVDGSYGSGDGVATVADEFYRLMHGLRFLPNSPTLMNAGRALQQLSACFVLPVEDSLDSIFETVKNTALIHKSGGGTGFSFSRIRPKGDRVRSTHGASSGPVSFIRVFDAATEAVKQGGTRRGANMAVLRVDHPDILEFIEAKNGNNELSNFNISVGLTDAFMEALAGGTDYVLVHPVSGKPSGHLTAQKVFDRICRSAWATGDPGLLFLDTIESANPTPGLGVIECTNPCGEQPLLPWESCNLGSINLSAFICCADGREGLDYGALARVVRSAVHFLDNVIDANNYPVPQVGEITRGNRKIGLGVMGWADLLIRLGIPYGSEQALTLADKVMGFIRREGHRASAELAAVRGPFPNFAHSRFPKTLPMRNATVTTVAPTGTVSIIAGCSSGIEPLFALSFTRENVLDGRTLPEVYAKLADDLREIGISPGMTSGSIQQDERVPEHLRRIYAIAHEISPEWHVRTQAAFQRHSDNAVSKTVNLPNDCSPADVDKAFRLAHRLGCKGITVYRDRCRESQVLNIGCAACA
jgi:ribonucleoside-diphosphate reductase alpha chain